jgi:hypothetical protein
MEHDAAGRLQNRDVADVAEFTTMVEIPTVKQGRCRRRCGQQNCEDRQQSRQADPQLDKTLLQ